MHATKSAPKGTAKSSSRVDDRRIQRTHQTLRDALIGLILEKGWDAISVLDLCDRANVGRSTFYTHFADKEDLLISGFADLRKGLRAMCRNAPGAVEPGQPLLFLRGLIEHVSDNQRLCRALVGKRSGLVVQNQFRKLLLDLLKDDLADVAPAGQRLDAAKHFLAGALFEMLNWWLEQPRGPEGPAQLEALFLQLALPVLATLRKAR